MRFVSRAGEKLQFALDYFGVFIKNKVCADFGSSTGGFVDCLLQNGVKRVYAVEVGHGVLDWRLRNNPRVVILERTNAMHVKLPEEMDFISIDVGWTRQRNVIPNALANLKKSGEIISLIKPYYEAPKSYLRRGRLMQERLQEVLKMVEEDIEEVGGKVLGLVESPLLGGRAKNKEFLAYIKLP